MKPKHYYNYSVLTVQKHWMYSDIYKRGKSTIRRLKKKTKWLTKMELQMNSEKCCMNSAKILQKKEPKSMTAKKLKKKTMNSTY